MSRRSRSFRRHVKERALKKAKRVLRIQARRWGQNPDKYVEDLQPQRWCDNLKKCSCTCCCSPRRNPWASEKEKLTKHELFIDEELEAAKKINMLSVVEAEEFLKKVLDGEYIDLNELDERD